MQTHRSFSNSTFRKRERFVNNEIVECLSRPQYKYSCSLTALTAVVNFLYADTLGIQTQEMVADTLGLNARDVGDDGGPGNEELLAWFKEFSKQTKQKGKCRVFLDKSDLRDYSRNEVVFQKLKETIRSNDRILICHREEHYNIVSGFFESAETPEEAFAADPYLYRWIILADHYPRHMPLFSVRWKRIREDFIDHSGYGLLLFER